MAHTGSVVKECCKNNWIPIIQITFKKKYTRIKDSNVIQVVQLKWVHYYYYTFILYLHFFCDWNDRPSTMFCVIMISFVLHMVVVVIFVIVYILSVIVLLSLFVVIVSLLPFSVLTLFRVHAAMWLLLLLFL